VHSPDGVRVSTFPGGVHGLGVIGAQVRAEFVRQAESNQSYSYRGAPVHVLNDSRTGRLLAILLGEIDEATLGPTSLMALRTAATSGVGFRHLVRRDAATVGLFGSGGQAANQLLALTTERAVRHVKVYSRDRDNRRRFAETYGRKFDLEIVPVETPREVVRSVDAVLCATNTNVPLFDGDWLEAGQHVTGIVGSNIQLVRGGFLKKRRRELDDRTAARADVIVANLRESVLAEEQGDLFEPIEKGIIAAESIRELGEVAAGLRPGRTRAEEITYHKNNNGTGVSEMALAMLAYRRARDAGRGLEIDLGPTY
jgi:ornithine cyclodeaminase